MRKKKPTRKKEKDARFDRALQSDVERERMKDDLHRRTDELTILQSTILDIFSPHQLPELLNLIVERAANLLRASSGGLYLTEPEHRRVRCVVSYKTRSDFTGTLLDYGVGAAGYVAETGKPIIIEDYAKWTGRADVYDEKQPFHAVMSAPMLWQGKVSGVIHILRDDVSNKFTQEELNLLIMFANHAAVAVENTRLLNIYEQELIERRKVENELRESEARFNAISATVGDMIFTIAPDGRIVYVNELAAQAFCSTPETIVGCHLREIFPPDVYQFQWDYLQKVFQTGGSLFVESLSHFGHGQVWLETWLTPLRDDNGNIVAVLGDSRDIAKRKAIEQELQAQRDFATQVINTMGQGLTVTNEDGRFVFVNPAYARLFGYEPEELIGKCPDEVTALDDHIALAEQRDLRKKGVTTTYESHLLRADGSIAPVVITGVPRERDGKYGGAIAVITDLTEQKQVEHELRRAKEELEAANRKLEEALDREKKLARTDALTGINNRRHLFELAEQKAAVALRYKQPLSVIMFDVDHFKKVNDTFGHLIGDQVLIRVIQVAESEMRKSDVIGRYGGEEFIIILPMANSKQAYVLAERIRKKVAAMRLILEQGSVSVTISVGVDEVRHHLPSVSVEVLCHRADEAMYRAKQSGRNCTVICE